jgi:hypothetical protein
MSRSPKFLRADREMEISELRNRTDQYHLENRQNRGINKTKKGQCNEGVRQNSLRKERSLQEV